jgi:hypothetical protein
MPANQFRPFIDEQSLIISSLLTEERFDRLNATVPIIFAEHKTLRGRAFLPVNIAQMFNSRTNILRLTIVYIDVTAVTHLNKKGYYECCLGGKEIIQME